jgi:UbiD family decarboxylase
VDMIPAGVDEVDIAGAIRGRPVELVKCKTVNLEVPATSEIVIEGYIDIAEDGSLEMRPEGPYGEYTGYRASGVHPRPVGTVTAITHRNDPILTMTCTGIPVDDGWVTNFAWGSDLLEELRDVRQFPIDFIYFPVEAALTLLVVSTDVPYKGYPKDLAMAIWGTKCGAEFANYVLAVNKDVDITDLTQVMWAMVTRVHPDRGILKIPNTFTLPLLPWTNAEEKATFMGARVFLDGTWPADWPKDQIPTVASFECIWPKEIQQRVLSNWKKYGF